MNKLSSKKSSKRLTKKSAKPNGMRIISQNDYKTYHTTVTPSLSCQEIAGFPSVYKWRYSTSATNQSFSVSTNPSTAFTQGFNYPYIQSSLGWSNLSDVYNKYCVTRSFVRLTVINKSTTVSYRVNVVPINSYILTSLPLATDDFFVDNPFSEFKVVSPLGSGPNLVNIQMDLPVHLVAGLPKPVDQFADQYCGTTGSANSTETFAAPISDYSWIYSVQSMDGTTIPALTIYYAVTHIYEVTFFDRLPKY
jgi:hypothetical protein